MTDRNLLRLAVALPLTLFFGIGLVRQYSFANTDSFIIVLCWTGFVLSGGGLISPPKK